LGQHIGEPNYDAVIDEPEPTCFTQVPANGGWIDTGCEVLPGVDFFANIDGNWCIDEKRINHFGRVGPEGYAALFLKNALAGVTHQNFIRRLPAPKCSAGALIGRIGVGPPFAILAGTPLVSQIGGRLFLACNDGDWRDNVGLLSVTLYGTHRIAILADVGVAAVDVAIIRFYGSLVDASGHVRVGVDVVVQRETWPHTIYGGGRTDSRGEFDVRIAIPRFVPVQVRFPEFRVGTAPKSYADDGELLWNAQLR
jgi:hypothetical protein